MTRLFGTNGVRGVVGQEMTPLLAFGLGRAIGTVLGSPVAVGRDTRTSGPMLQAAVLAGLTSVGTDVHDLGVAPSPAVQYHVKGHDLAGGVVVTASHNPPEYNGIKLLDGAGMEAPRELEERVEAVHFEEAARSAPWDGVGEIRSVEGANRRYVEAVRAAVDAEAIRRSRPRVVLDCANGAGCLTSPYLLASLGCEVVTLNAQPDGTFPGHPPEPREEHVGELRALVADLGADLGAVHDGDADRVVFVDEGGGFVHGDRSLALVAGHAVARAGGGTVVTPVSSSSCVEDVVRAAGGQVLYTPVGAPLVAHRMLEVGAVFGGEENGGLIFPRHQYCRDGALGLAVLLEILAARQEPLSVLLRRVPRYHLEKRSVPCPPEAREALVEALKARYRHRRVDATDGVKVFGDDGWVLVRPSGTEALVRIFAEGRTEGVARRLAEEATKAVEAELAGAGRQKRAR